MVRDTLLLRARGMRLRLWFRENGEGERGMTLLLPRTRIRSLGIMSGLHHRGVQAVG